jgi:hypothetical protein
VSPAGGPSRQFTIGLADTSELWSNLVDDAWGDVSSLMSDFTKENTPWTGTVLVVWHGKNRVSGRSRSC